MKYISIKQLVKYFLLYSLTYSALSCSEMASDSEIKADIATKAKQVISFAGVSYTVRDRVVTLTGSCPTEQERTKVVSKVEGIAGIKDVMNQIIIAPVILNSDFSLKQSVDSVLIKYGAATAEVGDSIIIVKGLVEKKEHEKLITALNQLSPKKLEDHLIVQ